MAFGCPVCNGISSVTKPCPHCGNFMEDSGRLENYYGPYSPYDNMELYKPLEAWNPADTLACIHLFSCPGCGYDSRLAFRQVVMG